MKRIDPKLKKRVDELAASDRDVGAVITVQDLSPDAKALTPDETTSLVDDLMHRVEAATGLKPSELAVQRNLGTFIIQAKPVFLRSLLEQSEVHHAASANAHRSERALIRPTRRKSPR